VLYDAITSNHSAIEWARSKGILSREMTCTTCGELMKEVPDGRRPEPIWRCTRTVNGCRHFKKQSIRFGSIFVNSHISIKEALFLIYEWASRTPRDEAAYQIGVDRKTTSGWYKMCRGVAESFVDTCLSNKIGDAGSIVEIDECQLGRRKHHRGRVPKELWVFGGVVRGSNPQVCFIEIVAKRDENTLVEVINRRIHPEARIISDGWKAYQNLGRLGFNHSIVNHSENFVSPSDNTIHTQGIENLWRCLRRFMSTKGSYSRKRIRSYVYEFIFRKASVDPFECILSAISDKYLLQ
jgi:transposase